MTSSGWAASSSLELCDEPVVFEVGDRRRGVDVVAPIVLANFVAEQFDLLFGGLLESRDFTSIESPDICRFGVCCLKRVYCLPSRALRVGGESVRR